MNSLSALHVRTERKWSSITHVLREELLYQTVSFQMTHLMRSSVSNVIPDTLEAMDYV